MMYTLSVRGWKAHIFLISPIKCNLDPILLEGRCPNNCPEIIGNGYFCASDPFWKPEMMWTIIPAAHKGFTKFLFNTIQLYVERTLLKFRFLSPSKGLVPLLSHGQSYSNTKWVVRDHIMYSANKNHAFLSFQWLPKFHSTMNNNKNFL